MVWKKTLSYGKVQDAARKIGSSLFSFTPPLREALRMTCSQCLELAKNGLIVFRGKDTQKLETFRLDDFTELQYQTQAEIRVKLNVLSVSVLASVRSACDEVLNTDQVYIQSLI
jgi:hypothetical protein